MDTTNIEILKRMKPHVERLLRAFENTWIRDYLITHQKDYWPLHSTVTAVTNSVNGLQNMARSVLREIDQCIEFGHTKPEGMAPSQPIDVVKQATSLFGATGKMVQERGWFCFAGIQSALHGLAEIVAEVDFPSYFRPSAEVYSVRPYRLSQSGQGRTVTITYYMPKVRLNGRAKARYGGRTLKVLSFNAWQAVIEVPDQLDVASGPTDFVFEIPTSDFWSFIRDASQELPFKVAVAGDTPFSFQLEMFCKGVKNWPLTDADGEKAISIHYPDGSVYSSQRFPGNGGDRLKPTWTLGHGDARTIELVEGWDHVKISVVFSDGIEINRSEAVLRAANPDHAGTGWTAKANGKTLTLAGLPIK